MRLFKKSQVSRSWEHLKRKWFRFSKSPLSKVGLAITAACVLVALLAHLIAPYPEHAGLYTDFSNAFQPPSLRHPFGTDHIGRDVLSRVIFGFQYSLMMAGTITLLVVPLGVFLGLIAGYYRDGWIDNAVMRIADIFISVPALVLALAICSVLTPSAFNAMIAVSLSWWPWYARFMYSMTSTLRNEYFIKAAEAVGASPFHIMFREIVPNCLGPLLTKITLDFGWIILIGASLSFVGLGAQPPTPDLGTMVAEGARYMPHEWWVCIFPALGISIIILGFNLLGDGIRDMYIEEAM